jgi:NAD(P)-dependent dehydrogenase (short-subunit alcohol dehydrogenase family)
LSGTEVAVDITSERSVEAMLARVRKRYGRIDAVVNSAYPKNRRFGRPFERTRYRDFCDNAARHLGGYFLVSQKSALFFKKQGGGNLVNLASIYAGAVPRFDIYRGTGKSMPVEYAAIKAGIVQMSRWMAAYAKKWRVRVNCISPGGILDGQSAAFLKRYNAFGASKGMLDAADVCGTLVFLLSDASRHVTGQNITVDDGWTL